MAVVQLYFFEANKKTEVARQQINMEYLHITQLKV